MLKFEFSIQTHNGERIDNIRVEGRDWADAEYHLLQMYRDCRVTHCKLDDACKATPQTMDIESLFSLIAKQN
jgi:hypothetical protein